MLAFIHRLLRPRRRVRKIVITLVLPALLLSGCQAARQPEPAANTAKQATLTLTRDADVQKAFADGRRSLLTQAAPRESFLLQDLDEQRALASDPRYLPDVLRLQADTVEKLSADPVLSDRVRANNLKVFRDLAKDPKYRPQLIAIMLDLLKDPQVSTALRAVMSTASGAGSGSTGSGPTGSGTAGTAGTSTAPAPVPKPSSGNR